MENTTYDLTRGSILKKLLTVALPLMANQLMQMSYNLTDMFWLGRTGHDAVSASGSAGRYMWFGAGLMMLGRIGCEIGVSQSLGKGDKNTAKKFTQNAAYIGGIVGIIYALVLIFQREPLIGFFGFREQHVIKDAQEYLMIVAIAVPMTNITSVIGGAYTGAGNSRTPFILNAMGLAVNMILDPLFINTFGMGVRGAAIATITGQIFVFFLSIFAVKLSRNRPFEKFSFFVKPDFEKILRMLGWASPIALESVLFCFLSMVTDRYTTSFGSYAMAVSQVGSQVESLTWLVGGGYASSLISYVGQNYGAKKFDRISRGINISFGIMGGWGLMVTLLLLIFGRQLFGIFLSEPTLMDYGAAFLKILAFAQIPMCMEGVSGGAFKGTGNSLPPAIVSISINVLRVVGVHFLSKTSLGLYGIWIAVSAGAVVKGIWATLWYLMYKKKLQVKMGV